MNEIKIADFGFARWMKQNNAETSCGSPHYAAPEVVRGTPYDGCAADIWSSGVILFALLSGRLPFYDPIVRNLLAKVKSGQFVMPDFLPEIQMLIHAMLTVDPSARITLDQIKQHPAFRIGIAEPLYVLPTPLPMQVVMEPIPIESISTPVLNILQQIGFSSDEELKEELESHGPSMAKGFYRMLTATHSLEELPWGPEELPDVVELPTGFDEDEKPGDVVQPCVDIPLLPEVLIGRMQAMLTSLRFQWFHPDDYTIYARLPYEKTGLTIKVKLQSAEYLSMEVHFTNATQITVGVVSERLTEILAMP
jgi:BR serine/threonine kinase